MKVLGLFTGRPKGMSEFLCKLALKEAAAAGAEVEAINIRTLNLKPCTGCEACVKNLFSGAKDLCVLKGDDMNWIEDKIYGSDGIIVVSPCFENSPPSEFKLLLDRMGPSHDYDFRVIANEERKKNGLPGLDERCFKKRPCAFIAHGGSEWTTLGLPTIEILAVPLGMKVVDLVELPWNSTLPLDAERLETVKRAGRAVGENLGKAVEDMTYVGKPGHCPMCHNYTMVLGENADEVTCAVCGMTGTISVVDGKIRIDYAEEQFAHSHVTNSGRLIHAGDLQKNGAKAAQMDKQKVAAIRAEAMDWLPTTKPVR